MQLFNKDKYYYTYKVEPKYLLKLHLLSVGHLLTTYHYLYIRFKHNNSIDVQFNFMVNANFTESTAKESR